MPGQEDAITVKMEVSTKAHYRHWCVDHAGGNMSLAVRLLIRHIIHKQPTWTQLAACIASLERGPEAGEGGC